MDAHEMLEKVKSGEVSVEEAEQYFRREPFEELGYAKLDTHRKLRSGFPEVIFCSGKDTEHLLHIYQKLYEEEGEVFGTRASAEQFELLRETLPELEYDPISRIMKIEKKVKDHVGRIAVCTAGTADIPVAEEAAQTAEYFGTVSYTHLERNPDSELQEEMQGCLERIQQLLNTMMMSSKLKNMENDVRYERVYLEEAVNEALKNQSYFLIREHFQIEKKLEGAVVYSDRRWLVYMLDQLIGNAVKYRTKQPALTFEARCISADEVELTVKDNGIGIAEGEIPYIFDRGYIGSNLRNGDYRSTGMGLSLIHILAYRILRQP